MQKLIKGAYEKYVYATMHELFFRSAPIPQLFTMKSQALHDELLYTLSAPRSFMIYGNSISSHAFSALAVWQYVS